MIWSRLFMVISGFIFLFASTAMAQFPVVTGDDVRTWTDGKRKVVLIDSRLAEEYEAGHIPGAINIPPERMTLEAARLPKDKTTPMIFYCRGVG